MSQGIARRALLRAIGATTIAASGFGRAPAQI